MDESRRADAGSAGKRLGLDAALERADAEDAPGTGRHKICIGAGRGEGLVVAGGGALGGDIHGVGVVHEDHRVRNPGVQEVDLAESSGEHEILGGAARVRLAHFEGDPAAREFRANPSGTGIERDPVRDPLEAGGIAREAPGSIAAHFGFTTVRIEIPHAQPPGVAFDHKHPVGTHTPVAVTEERNLAGLRKAAPVPPVEHHKVVARAVHLGECKVSHGPVPPSMPPQLRLSSSRLAAPDRISSLAIWGSLAEKWAMLRPRKRYTIYDLRQCKGRRCLTHIHVKSPEEAAAAAQAGVDLMSCSFDTPEAQARLPLLVAAAPDSFFSAATPHGLASAGEAIRVGFRALEAGASSVYCSASPLIIEAMAREGLPVVGHLGLVPRHVTWTGYRAIGKSVPEAVALYGRMKALENAGAWAAELEVVPHNLARFLSSRTGLILMSLGSGTGCDTQFLFSDDILGEYEERPPRHAKAYRNFAEEYRRLQRERVAAFGEYLSDVREGRFPEDGHLVVMDEDALREVGREVDGSR